MFIVGAEEFQSLNCAFKESVAGPKDAIAVEEKNLGESVGIDHAGKTPMQKEQASSGVVKMIVIVAEPYIKFGEESLDSFLLPCQVLRCGHDPYNNQQFSRSTIWDGIR